jgi:hypothetical protein
LPFAGAPPYGAPIKRAVILLTLAAAALAGPVAVAIATAHRVHPTVSVLSENVRGKLVGFTLDVSFKVPRGAKPGSACKGKIGVSVKKSHWSGRLAASKGLCDARVKGKLPKAAEGTKVRFKVAFAAIRSSRRSRAPSRSC